MIPLLLACASPPPAAPGGELIFVRDGIVVPAEVGGQKLAGRRTLVRRQWNPGERVDLGGGWADKAPAAPECSTLFEVPLGDVSRLVAMGREAPDTALSWSGAGDLAIGSYLGDVMVVDGWTGEVLARRNLAESMVKQVAWSEDGDVLYAAEQSPSATLHALDPATLVDRWSVDLSDRVGTSPLPAGEDKLGVYDLPGAYALQVLGGGDLLVVATHAWTAGAERKNASQVVRLSPSGDVVATWPAEPVGATFLLARTDDTHVAVVVNHSASAPPPADLPIGGVQVLRLDDLSPISQHRTRPLEPWFKAAYMWEAVDVDRERVFMGFGDGRVLIETLQGERTVELSTGAPVMAGEVPIAASVSFGFMDHGQAVFLTSGTNIPWGAAAPELRPPTTHPNENTLWVQPADGSPGWSWRGAQALNGVSPGPDGRTVVVGAGERSSDDRRDLFGVLLFDLSGEQRPGRERLLLTCSTSGPVFFRQALSADGRIGVAEYPVLKEDGSVDGTYQVTVLY